MRAVLEAAPFPMSSCRDFNGLPMPRILILSGEASGDQHGASLAEALKSRDPDIELEGLGGARMEAAGVRLLSGIDKLDIIGVPTLPELRRAYVVFHKLARYIRENTFDAVVLIDNPGLNLRLARVAKRAGQRVIYYIAPQIWAWNEGRIKKIRRYVDRLLVILPFERAYFGKAGVDCRFVGHPIMDELQQDYDVAALRREFGLSEAGSIVGLLPGSRKSEILRLLPVMLDAAKLLLAENSSKGGAARQCVLVHAASVPRDMIDGFIAAAGIAITVIPERPYEAIALCDAVMVASGTATLQTALVGRPMTIVYRTGALTYQIYKRLIKVPWIGLANLVAGRQIAAELIQDNLTPDRLTVEIELLLTPERAQQARDVSAELRKSMGAPGASGRAADEIMNMIREASNNSRTLIA